MDLPNIVTASIITGGALATTYLMYRMFQLPLFKGGENGVKAQLERLISENMETNKRLEDIKLMLTQAGGELKEIRDELRN